MPTICTHCINTEATEAISSVDENMKQSFSAPIGCVAQLAPMTSASTAKAK
ncbi:hypothetical protein ACO0KZ_07680 [Undibacterium sp. Di24W]